MERKTQRSRPIVSFRRMKKLVSLIFLLMLVSNCDRNDDIEPEPVACTSVLCTLEFRTLNVLVKDNDGVSIPLDRFEVVDGNTSEDLTPELSSEELLAARQFGQYPIYSDAFVSGNQNTERTLIFRGFINEVKLAEAEYVIATDCCHVDFAVGNPNIFID